MPTYDYPGVYVEEVPSGVRTITGVATAVAAFLGRALRGPVNEPVTINGYADFERIFGGLWVEGPMSYAIRDFYMNGGSQAIIVRLFNGEEQESTAQLAMKTSSSKTFGLEAASPGEWGKKLAVAVDADGIDTDVAERFGLNWELLFNLTLTDTSPGGRTEQHRNLSVAEGPRRVDRVLALESQLARVRGKLPKDPPSPTPEVEARRGSNGGGLGSSEYLGSRLKKTGLYALERADLFNLLCIPPDGREGNVRPDVLQEAMAYCEQRRALLLVDPPVEWGADPTQPAAKARDALSTLGLSGVTARNAALYFPRIVASDPLREGRLETFAPCGAVAGLIARTDAQVGVWKAPAGLDASLSGIHGLQTTLTDAENGMLNPLGINCLRSFPVGGRVIWGARTLRGADQLADEYKYVPVRRLALFLEESLYRGTQWVVFEGNDEPLWAQIRLNVGAFLNTLFRQGAFQGTSPREAYFVKCDKETTTQDDINRGVVNIVVGFAPLKPAEFVVIKVQQIAGQIET